MTEAEWLAIDEFETLQCYLGGIGSERKLRLLAAACVRETVTNSVGYDARLAEVLERVADGLGHPDELRLWRDWQGRNIESSRRRNALYSATREPALIAAAGAVWHLPPGLAAVAASGQSWDDGRWRLVYDAKALAVKRRIWQLLGCITGASPVCDPAWLTSAVVSLARQMYDSRDFSSMPILVDALQDAGCDHPDILAHCRGPGSHVRGCWVVDLVLGKA
ncbi:MAG: hypothetical protein JWO38_4442 [Gemmataceae bacterium]|nr:hypothetical protein [Gemmataceae bacterium]